MTDGYRPHELLLSDDYWRTKRLTHPELPLGYLILEGLSGGLRIAAMGTEYRVRGLYKLAEQSGYVPEEVPKGEELPVLPRGEGLLRVIRDYKLVKLHKELTSTERNQTDSDEFDSIAQQILANKLYAGQPAHLTLNQDDTVLQVQRTVSYLTGSRTGRILEGIGSQHIRRICDLEVPEICFPVVVGEPYAIGKNKDSLYKVVKAEILVPGSGSKSKAKKSKAKVKFQPVVA